MIDVLVIPLAALAIPIVVGPIAILAKHAQRDRELEHAERMRAMEVGATLTQDEPWWTPARLVVLIAGVVPVASMGIAGFIDWFGGARPGLWESCGLVAGAGLVCGTYLAGRVITVTPSVEARSIKPHYDPDAFDVVSSRG